jgi:hypothetical protein
VLDFYRLYYWFKCSNQANLIKKLNNIGIQEKKAKHYVEIFDKQKNIVDLHNFPYLPITPEFVGYGKINGTNIPFNIYIFSHGLIFLRVKHTLEFNEQLETIQINQIIHSPVIHSFGYVIDLKLQLCGNHQTDKQCTFCKSERVDLILNYLEMESAKYDRLEALKDFIENYSQRIAMVNLHKSDLILAGKYNLHHYNQISKQHRIHKREIIFLFNMMTIYTKNLLSWLSTFDFDKQNFDIFIKLFYTKYFWTNPKFLFEGTGLKSPLNSLEKQIGSLIFDFYIKPKYWDYTQIQNKLLEMDQFSFMELYQALDDHKENFFSDWLLYLNPFSLSKNVSVQKLKELISSEPKIKDLLIGLDNHIREHIESGYFFNPEGLEHIELTIHKVKTICRLKMKHESVEKLLTKLVRVGLLKSVKTSKTDIPLKTKGPHIKQIYLPSPEYPYYRMLLQLNQTKSKENEQENL